MEIRRSSLSGIPPFKKKLAWYGYNVKRKKIIIVWCLKRNSLQKYKHNRVIKDAEPSITIECNPNEGWEEDVKDSELTRAVRRVVDSTLDKNVHAKVEPKEVGYSLIILFFHIFFYVI